MKTMNSLASPIFALVIATGIMDSVESQAGDPTKALATLQEEILSRGPHGEEPSPASSVSLTTEEFEKIRDS